VGLAFVTHPDCLLHEMGPGHPERPERLAAIEDKLIASRLDYVISRYEAPLATPEHLLRVHDAAYLEALSRIAPEEGLVQLDPDTAMNPHTLRAALRAAGAAVLATDLVIAGKSEVAFCAVRPPGHHAETARPMGFCLFNSVAVAARHAQKQHGVDRVAIVDFDVHHGNGSQEIFWSDPTVMYCSTHEMPLYPGTGATSETGEHHNIVNAPLRAGDGGDKFREAMTSVILPRLDGFKPDLLLISAGFDAHARDPLANLNLVEADFAWVTAQLMDRADRYCGGRVVSVLEGGYDLEGLAQSVAAHVTTLMRG
jgi:acetoin utilization deacetylase AcuC-like enzyme